MSRSVHDRRPQPDHSARIRAALVEARRHFDASANAPELALTVMRNGLDRYQAAALGLMMAGVEPTAETVKPVATLLR